MKPAGDTANLTAVGPGRMALAGELTFTTAPALWDAAERLLAARASDQVDVDLGGVTRADSAGLALLVGWLSRAQGAGVKLRYLAVPERLRAIAHISEVDGLLDGSAPSL